MTRTPLAVLVLLFALSAASAQMVIEEETDEINVVLDTAVKHSKSTPAAISLSALVPGLGEAYLNSRHRATWHFLGEAALIGGFLACFAGESQAYEDARSYAYLHAGANAGVAGKGKEYYQNIGDYYDVWAYNGVQTLSRETDKLYPETEDWGWAWDGEDSYEEYKGMLVHQRSLKIVGSFMLGGMALHRFISMVDAARLAKRYRVSAQNRVSIQFTPQRLQISLGF